MADSNADIVCSFCGAPIAAGQQVCWLCQKSTAATETENPYISPRPLPGESSSVQFSLASLFLVMTLAAVGMGAFLLAPGLGVLFAFVSVPALIRTVVATSRTKRKGGQVNTLGKVEIFIVSVFIVGAVGLASFVAFTAVCFAGAGILEAARAPMEALFIVGFGGGLVAAIVVAVFLFRLTQPGG